MLIMKERPNQMMMASPMSKTQGSSLEDQDILKQGGQRGTIPLTITGILLNFMVISINVMHMDIESQTVDLCLDLLQNMSIRIL